MNFKLGSELPPNVQQDCLARFVHRFTREHRPYWAKGYTLNGKPYAVQFASDADWLAHTLFAVTKSGCLDNRGNHCQSSPTWPDNPELRTHAA